MARKMRTVAKALVWFVIGIFFLCIGMWSVLAIYFSNLPNATLRGTVAALFGIGSLVAFIVLPNRRRTAIGYLIACTFVAIWWWWIPASHNRPWVTSVAVLPHAEIQGEQVAVYNIRNFDYRTTEDFTVRYYDKTFDLNDLETVDFVKSHWDNLEDVAHTMLSFGFRGGDYLAVSVETRLERGEPQTALRGIFKQYELIYVLADERDLLRLRTNVRGEDLYVYPTTSTPEEVRILFLDVLSKVNQIATKPEYYSTLTQNCTLSLVPHLEKIRPRRLRPSFWELLINGHTDEIAHRNGWIKSDGSFPETKALHHVNQYVVGDPDPADYSKKIRPHLTNP